MEWHAKPGWKQRSITLVFSFGLVKVVDNCEYSELSIPLVLLLANKGWRLENLNHHLGCGVAQFFGRIIVHYCLTLLHTYVTDLVTLLRSPYPF